MKLIILSQYFVPEIGAPQNRLYELASELQLIGWDLQIFTSLPNYPTGKIFQKYRNRLYCREKINGIEVHRYTLYPSNSRRRLPRIASMISFSITSLAAWRKIRRFRPEFLFVESPPLTLGFSGWFLSRISGAKLIMNVSDIWPLSAKELGAISDGWLYRMLERAERFLYKEAALCTGQSQEIVDHISINRKDGVYLLRNGVDTSRFGNLHTERSHKVVYAGLLGVAQGILSVCKGINFQELGYEFHIYGDGAEKDAIQLFLSSNADRGIQYRGAISRQEIPSILPQYDAAFVSLVKNIYGAVPSKIYEAMAAGLPIIFVGEGEGAAIVRDYQVGWTSPPENWKSLAENLNRLRELNDSAWRAMRERSKTVAAQAFDRKNQARLFHEKLALMTSSNEDRLK